MDPSIAIAALIFGAIIGSFLNALLFRFNTGRIGSLFSPLSSGRSRCMRCAHQLGPLDLVPVFSYLFLRGRCRYCGAKISLQYPLVEAAMALLSLATYIVHPEPLEFAFWFVVWAVLLLIVVYDLRHKIIPWTFSLVLLGLALAYIFLLQEPTLWGVLAGPLLALPLFLLCLVSGGRWMGWGDPLLELSLGTLLGLSLGASALMYAFWSGAAIGLILILFSRWRGGGSGLTIKSEIPFAPFLVLGALIAHFFHADLFSTLSIFWQ